MSSQKVSTSPEMVGENIVLRAPLKSDIEQRLKIGQSAEYIHMVGGDTRKFNQFTMEDATTWYEYVSSNPFNWIIELKGKYIGNARLIVSDHEVSARYAIGIHDDSEHNKGYGTEVTKLILDYAFNVLRLQRVELCVLEYNTRAIACYKKCGFKIERTERTLIEDRWETDVIMSILGKENQ
jgi:[ribosomal protein S5]-alanine N-acetyltransferase